MGITFIAVGTVEKALLLRFVVIVLRAEITKGMTGSLRFLSMVVVVTVGMLLLGKVPVIAQGIQDSFLKTHSQI